MHRKMILALAALVGLFIASPAQAVVLAPGQGSPVPDVFVAETGTLVGTQSGALNNTGSGGNINATYQEWVYREASGNLTFIYQVSVKPGSDALEQVAVASFKGFTTDVGITPVPLVGPPAGLVGGQTPFAGVGGNVVTRSGSGSAVNFNFTGGGIFEVGPGQHTVLLTVMTNARYDGGGTITVQDDTSVFTKDLGPVPTPEPSTMALAGLGALGLIGYGHRRRKARTA